MMRLSAIQSFSFFATLSIASSSKYGIQQSAHNAKSLRPSSLHTIRGGTIDTTAKKTSKSSKKKSNEIDNANTKHVINEKMRESDAATAMGDAIR